jgi:hypothetical protein
VRKVDSDEELIAKVVDAIDKVDFFRSILSDTFTDWNLSKDFGEFLVTREPDTEIMGHLLLVRSNRHLGNRQIALDELKKCQDMIRKRELTPWEIEMITPVLKEEEQFLAEK